MEAARQQAGERMSAAAIGALAAITVALLGLIGVPLSAELTGIVTAATERTKRRATQESDALGRLLRAWICMDNERPKTRAHTAALEDWQTGLIEIAAYGTSQASQAFARFVAQGADASTERGQELLVEAVFAVRRGAFHRHLPIADKQAIFILLFGTRPSGVAAPRTGPDF
jgi:hypothetical protein